MMRYVLIVVIAMALVMTAVYSPSTRALSNPPTAPQVSHILEPLSITTKDGTTHDFQVDLVSEAAELEKGLMFRESMPETEGMLFWFGPPGRPLQFWMKNTLIPLDMIFIDEKGVILYIEDNATPETLTPRGPTEGAVVAVLEINGGLSG